MTERERATHPEDLTRLFVERANAGDVDGLLELYAADAVLGFPPGEQTVGHEAIRPVLEAMLKQVPSFPSEPALPTLVHGDLALCATRSADGTGTRAQVARRRPDGTWERIIDRPESRS
jgi:ketosteroid isomerase-like protein